MNRTQPLSLVSAARSRVIALLAVVAALALLLLVATPSTAQATEGDMIYGTVTSELALYESPEEGAAQGSSLAPGTSFQAAGVGNGWYGAKFPIDGASVPLYFSDLSGIVLYQPVASGVLHGAVMAGGLNVYVAPSTGTDVLQWFSEGQTIQFISFSDGWYAARLASGQVCYIPASSVALYNPTEEGTLMRFAGEGGTIVYAAPDTSSTVLAAYDLGTTLYFADFNADWYAASLDGRTVYVLKSSVTTDPYVPPVVSTDPNGYSYDITLTQLVEVESSSSWIVSRDGSWRSASDYELRSYLNPANFPQGTTGYYQFLRLDQVSGFTVDQLNGFLVGEGVLEGQGQAFYDACQQYGINEAYLIAHSELESGHGKSDLSRGVWYDPESDIAYDPYSKKAYSANGEVEDFDLKDYPDAVKVYNQFGFGAYDSNPLYGGAKMAYEQGWTSVSDSIKGAAELIYERYLSAGSTTLSGQNTLYKMLFHPECAVANLENGSYEKPWHEYATDIAWAAKIATLISYFYPDPSAYYLTFEVPVYAGN